MPKAGRTGATVISGGEQIKRGGGAKPGADRGLCYLQVLGLGTDTGDAVPSVLLFFDHQRLLFNSGEGFQRFCTQHKVRMTKLNAVLATRMSTEALGGLPGMLLTMADAKGGAGGGALLGPRTALTLYGPPGVGLLYNAMRTFINLRDLGLKLHEFDGHAECDPVLEDAAVKITPLVLRPAAGPPAAVAEGAGGEACGAAAEGAEPAAKRQRINGDSGGGGGDSNGGAAVRNKRPGDGVAVGGDVRDGEVVSGGQEPCAVCYIAELADVRGRFDPAKAAALGVPRGPLYGQLQRGQPVSAANGRVVQPEEVMGPTQPGPVAVVIDCPSAHYTHALFDAPQLQAFMAGAPDRKQVTVMVHLSPADVADSADYRAWMDKFGDSAQHLLVHHPAARTTVALRNSATIQAQLNALDPQVFPVPASMMQAHAPAAEACGTGNVQPGLSMAKFHLLPVRRGGYDTADVPPPLDLASIHNDLREQRPDVFAALPPVATAASAVDDVPDVVRTAGRNEAELVMLGTGAAVPSKYRNVTGQYLHLFERGGIVLDCGEGSLGQLRRRYGAAGCDDVLRALRCVWVSHIHADHHVGLPRLLAARARVLGAAAPPLLVLGPRQLRRALVAYSQLEPMSFRYVDNANLLAGAVPAPELMEPVEEVKSALGLTSLQTVRVEHCAHAYGLALGGRAGWRMAFSGDTRPCDDMVEAAAGATLLVHEATFEDALADEAVAKQHTLVGEAVEIGRKAGAYRTMLTHFSQRYPKMPPLGDAAGNKRVCVAFDLMCANLADLPRLPALIPALQLLFKEDEEEEGEEEEDEERGK